MLKFIEQQKNIIPVYIMGLVLLNTIYNVLFIKIEVEGEFYKQSLSISNILGFLSFIINIYTFNFKRNLFKQTILATLFFSLIGIIKFTINKFLIGFGPIPLDSLSIIISIYYLIFNFKKLRSKSQNQNTEDLNEEEIEKLESKFKNKSDEELISIIEDKRFTKEAKVASQKILNIRNTINISND